MDSIPRPVDAGSMTGHQRQVYLNGLPDACPLCHRHVVPQQFSISARGDGPEDPVEIVYRCTNHNCQRYFIGIFTHLSNPSGPEIRTDRKHFRLAKLTPTEPQKPLVPDLVITVSPSFTQAYQQAVAADAFGLDQLAGVGLRKALEFLVKDFAIRSYPDKKESILSSALALCISQYIVDENVKQCAKRAAWLGNDETHYVRRWEDRDINDLKILIRLVVNWVENVLLTEKYVTEMPEPPKM
ncbi:MAG: DUF4145 domain-containing protein [Deltaproteobacteria bacterium]|nr:DUF4145 domain-containing protein [Deltaproteobacteria bacterium]